MHLLRGLAFLIGLLVCFSYPAVASSSPAAASSSEAAGDASSSEAAGAARADVRLLYQLMLEWVVLAKPLPGKTGRVVFPDRNLIRDASVVHISSENSPPGLRLTLPNRRIRVLPEERLKQIAAETGKYPALYFSKLRTFGEFAELSVGLQWYLGEPSGTLPLSSGEVRIRFRWKGGTWEFEKRLGMRIS